MDLLNSKKLDKLRLNNIIENGGWHVCNLKDPNDLLYKYIFTDLLDGGNPLFNYSDGELYISSNSDTLISFSLISLYS